MIRPFLLILVIALVFAYFVLAPYWTMPFGQNSYKYAPKKSSQASFGEDPETVAVEARLDYPIVTNAVSTETPVGKVTEVESTVATTTSSPVTVHYFQIDANTSSKGNATLPVTTMRSSSSGSPHPIYDDDTHDSNFRQEYERLSCRFPLLDPWDDSILPFLSHPQPLTCPWMQPDVTYVDSDGYLRFNLTEYGKAVSMYGNLSCYYRHFDKLDDNDHSVTYVDGGKYFHPPAAIRLTHETVEVKCSRSSRQNDHPTTDKEIYSQIHAHPLFTSNISLRNEHTDDRSLSVLLIIADSLSVSAFRRHLPSTYDYVRNVMRFHTFRGNHKIGDNSFPNHLAVLLGRRVVDEHYPDMMDEVREEYRRIQFDHWPLVWRLFSEKGYETSFNEDTPHWGLFHYFLRGFAKKPVHHYYHQYWLAVNRDDFKHQSLCFRNKAKLQLQLDLIRKHLKIGRNRKWFDYVSVTELFHQEEGYEAEKADSYFRRFFQEMYERGYFDRTAIIFMSDHGHRYASLRQTLVGLVEERLPMLNVWFPDWFYKGNDFNATLHNNTFRLTSQFDIHETLLDILHNNYQGSQRPMGTRGLSLLYPIPYDRTCSQAGIPNHYCTCLKEESLPTNDSIGLEAVKAAVARVNAIVSNYSQCSQLTVAKILRVESLGVNEEIARGISDLESARKFHEETSAPAVRSLNKLRVTFVTAPGNALFEATTSRNGWKSLWVVDGKIYRLNAYGATSYCIQDKFLFNYCICRDIR